jgi:hypothetical protein
MRLVGASVPVPEVLHAEPRGLDELPPFCLLHHVEGTSFRDLVRSGDAEAMAQAAYSAGATLAAIGRTTFSTSGWLGPGPTLGAPLLEGADPIPRFVDRCLASPPLERRVPLDMRSRIHEVMWSWLARLAGLGQEAHLVHGDFNRRNLLMERVAGRWFVAAVALMDRNANMASVQVRARIDMATGSVVDRIAIGGDCLDRTQNTQDVPSCVTPAGATRAGKAAPLPLAGLHVPANAQEETISPSGGWSVLSLVSSERDYMHRPLFLVDRSRLLLYPIAAGPFAQALTAAQRAHLGDFQGTVDAVGESPVRWLDQDDALLVDSLLAVPGRGGVELGGDVAH